jgi:hypothetical protein
MKWVPNLSYEVGPKLTWKCLNMGEMLNAKNISPNKTSIKFK